MQHIMCMQVGEGACRAWAAQSLFMMAQWCAAGGLVAVQRAVGVQVGPHAFNG